MDRNDLSTVKLIDFGLAVKSDKVSIQDFAKCGTLLYTPPEQVMNNFAYAKVSNLNCNLVQKADMWAVGIIMY